VAVIAGNILGNMTWLTLYGGFCCEEGSPQIVPYLKLQFDCNGRHPP
jgi:hypothetical protein